MKKLLLILVGAFLLAILFYGGVNSISLKLDSIDCGPYPINKCEVYINPPAYPEQYDYPELWNFCEGGICVVRIYRPHVSWTVEPPDGMLAFKFNTNGGTGLRYVYLWGEDAKIFNPGPNVYMEWYGDASWFPCDLYELQEQSSYLGSLIIMNDYGWIRKRIGCSRYLPIILKGK